MVSVLPSLHGSHVGPSDRNNFLSLGMRPQAKPQLLPSEVKQEGPEVAGGVFCIHSCGRGHRDEDLITCTKFKQAALVDGVKGVLAVWRPTFGPHTLQELNRPSVGSLLVDTLHHLVADRSRLVIVHGEGEITEVDLGVQVVAACARNTQAAVGHGHVVQVGAKTLVPPGTDRMAT